MGIGMSQVYVGNANQVSPPPAIITIDGDVGSVTGSTISFLATPHSGSTVQFNGSGTTMEFNVTDSFGNTIIGKSAGNNSISAGTNTGLGTFVFDNLTSGSGNVSIGASTNISTGANNTILGQGAYASGNGSRNILIGSGAGSAFTTTESSNIVMGSLGTITLNNSIIIGTQGSGSGQQNKCFIAGINGATVVSQALVTINTVDNQLGTIPYNPSGFPWTDVTTATQFIAIANAGFVTDHADVAYQLPVTANLGDTIIIVGKLGISTITQNAGQQILIGSASSTVGIGGSVNGTNVGDCITLICITAGANTVWRASSFVGNWTVT
jgi:hypothetical protein